MGAHFGEDELGDVIHQYNCSDNTIHEDGTYCVQFITEVDGVDVIAFQVGEHDYLGQTQYKFCADEWGDARRRPL